MCDKTHTCVWHDSLICLAWRIHMCDITPSYVWHDSLIRVTWLIDTCDVTQPYVYSILSAIWRSHVWKDPSICAVRLLFFFWHELHARDTNHPSKWHDSILGVIWRLRVWKDQWIRVVRVICFCDMTFMRVTQTIHHCDTTHRHVWHDPFIVAPWRMQISIWHELRLIQNHDMTHSYLRVTSLTHVCCMMH